MQKKLVYLLIQQFLVSKKEILKKQYKIFKEYSLYLMRKNLLKIRLEISQIKLFITLLYPINYLDTMI